MQSGKSVSYSNDGLIYFKDDRLYLIGLNKCMIMKYNIDARQMLIMMIV